VTSLLLIRHAETDMVGRFCGHCDPELNQRGRQQLVEVGNRLAEHKIDRVFTSDLRRAQQTAEIIATHFRAGLHIRPGLREIYFGRWEGLSWKEIEIRDPVLAKKWAEEYPRSTAPGGESCRQFDFRVRGEMAFLRAQAAKWPVAAVTHAGFIRVALTNWCGVSQQEAWEQTKDYGSIVALDTNHLVRASLEDPDAERSAVTGTQ